MALSNLFKTQYKLADFALINHMVPSHRLKRAIPEQLSAETFKFEGEKEEMGLISVSCAHYKNYWPGAIPGKGLEFWEISYRTYVLFKGLPCVYFFASEFNSWSSFLANRLQESHASKAKMNVTINRDPSGHYELYEGNLSSDRGNLQFVISAKDLEGVRSPFLNSVEMENFFYDRYHHIHNAPIGHIGDQILAHHKSKRLHGELSLFDSGFWIKKGLLKEQEMQENFHSCLVSPIVKYEALPIIPMRFIPGSA